VVGYSLWRASDLRDLHAEVLHACFKTRNRDDDAWTLLALGKPPLATSTWHKTQATLTDRSRRGA